jgi:tetratricopeptide (TPR) repeat protein
VLLREYPSRPQARERHAVRLARGGELDAALAELAAMDTGGRAGIVRIELLFAAKRYAQAARHALELAPSQPQQQAAELWTLRARALAELGDDEGWAAAISSLRQVLSADVDRLAYTYALEGELHRRRGQNGSALRAFRQAYGIKNDPSYLAQYAGISLHLGDQAAALWAYMRLCELEPDHPGYCAARDRILARSRVGDFEAKVPN